MEMMGMQPMTGGGKYPTRYERGADGRWRIRVETWNTSMPPPMPEAAKMPEAGKKKT
jgi:ketosteroid isomerase-like protein